jgi:hypothetical protein
MARSSRTLHFANLSCIERLAFFFFFNFRNLYFRAIKVNLLINFPAIRQYILLVYVQVGDAFACLSNNLRSQQSLSFDAVMQMVLLQPPGEN